MTKETKKASKPSNVDLSISKILEALKSINNRLSELENYSHEPMDIVDDISDIDSRLSRVEGRMGL